MGPINSSFLLVLSKFFSGDYTWTFCGFVLLCTAEHSIDLIWFWKALMVEYCPGIWEDQLVMLNCTKPHSDSLAKRRIWSFLSLGFQCWPLLHWKLFPMPCKTHLRIMHLDMNSIPFPSDDGKWISCILCGLGSVCAHVPVCTGSFSDRLGRWHPVAHLFWCFWRMTVGKGCSSSPNEYLIFILMEKRR